MSGEQGAGKQTPDDSFLLFAIQGERTMLQHFCTWIGGLAIVLLPAATSFAQEAGAKADVHAGPVHVRVHANSDDGEPVQVQINGQPVPIHVETQQGRPQGVRVNAGPVHVDTQKGPAGGVRVHAGPAHVDTQQGPDGGVRVHAGPVHVETQEGPDGGVRVHAGPVHVQGQWGLGGQPVQLSEYWIGLELQPTSDALRVQLGLPEGQGLIVANVMPESPAAEAGLQQHDVLLTAGAKPLGELADLVAAIDEAKGAPLALGLIRAGKAQKIVVTPAKRPETPQGEGFPPALQRPEWQEYVERFLPRRLDGTRPYRFRFYHPGFILPPGAAVTEPMPSDLSVTINKQGDQPAKVVVKRGDQTWEVTEETLDELPADVRIHVEPMLGRIPGGVDVQHFDFVPNMHMPGQPEGQLQEDLEFHEAKPQTRVEKRIEELNRRMEELRQSVDDLREKRRPSPAADGQPE